MTGQRFITLISLGISLALHVGALAALLTGSWPNRREEVPYSVELVIVSAPLDEPAATVATDEPAAPATAAIDPPPEPAPAIVQLPAPEPPKPVQKQDVAKPVPMPQRPPAAAPKPIDRPITLDPGSIGGDDPQVARAPATGPSSPSFSVVYGPIPPYPPQARSRGQEGRVVLAVTIGTDGNPSNVSVLRSSGAPLLDQSAVNTVRTWRFSNASGRAVDVTVPIVFELRATAGR